MAHCFQFISPAGEPIGLSQLDNDIRRDVFGLSEDDEHHCAPFMLVQLLTSPGGLQPAAMANDKELPECVRRVAEYLVRRGITSKGWQEGADGRLIRWITPRGELSKKVILIGEMKMSGKSRCDDSGSYYRHRESRGIGTTAKRRVRAGSEASATDMPGLVVGVASGNSGIEVSCGGHAAECD